MLRHPLPSRPFHGVRGIERRRGARARGHSEASTAGLLLVNELAAEDASKHKIVEVISPFIHDLLVTQHNHLALVVSNCRCKNHAGVQT
jgi:hypothetical protein